MLHRWIEADKQVAMNRNLIEADKQISMNLTLTHRQIADQGQQSAILHSA